MNWKMTFTILTLMCINIPAHAAQWSNTFSVSYTLGDNDNRAGAREIALNELRLLAAAAAGKYVQGDEHLRSDTYSQSIHVAAATIVSITNIKTSLSVNTLNQSVLHMTAMATVDDTELKHRINALQHDQARMERLAKKGRKMDALIEKLSSGADISDVSELVDERNMLIHNLTATLNEAKVEFSPGMVFTTIKIKHKVDKKKQQALTDELAKRMRMVDHTILIPILERTRISLTVDEPSERGSKYILPVSVSWKLKADVLIEALENATRIKLYAGTADKSMKDPDDFSRGFVLNSVYRRGWFNTKWNGDGYHLPFYMQIFQDDQDKSAEPLLEFVSVDGSELSYGYRNKNPPLDTMLKNRCIDLIVALDGVVGKQKVFQIGTFTKNEGLRINLGVNHIFYSLNWESSKRGGVDHSPKGFTLESWLDHLNFDGVVPRKIFSGVNPTHANQFDKRTFQFSLTEAEAKMVSGANAHLKQVQCHVLKKNERKSIALSKPVDSSGKAFDAYVQSHIDEGRRQTAEWMKRLDAGQ